MKHLLDSSVRIFRFSDAPFPWELKIKRTSSQQANMLLTVSVSQSKGPLNSHGLITSGGR